jgi:hypothetical protein
MGGLWVGGLWVSGVVSAEQTESGKLEPASSVRKREVPTIHVSRELSDKKTKEREWKKVKNELQQLESVIENELQVFHQATRQCESKSKGGNNSQEILDGKEITRQMES